MHDNAFESVAVILFSASVVEKISRMKQGLGKYWHRYKIFTVIEFEKGKLYLGYHFKVLQRCENS